MTRQLSVAWWLAVVAAWSCAVSAVLVPGCQVVAPQQKTLNKVRVTRVGVPSPPFELVYASQQKNVAFVALNTTLDVLNTTTFTPNVLHQIPMPAAYLKDSGALGITLTRDGRYVLVSLGTGAVVVDAAKAVNGSSAAVVSALHGTVGAGAIEITVTSDEYVFLSQEYRTAVTGNRGAIEVFKLHKKSPNGLVSGIYIGYLTLGDAVVGTALSPDGSILYATSEISGIGTREGSLNIIDVETMKKNPSNALLGNTTGGCGAVRIAVSSDGKAVWLTARESNHLLALDAAKLLSNPSETLIASVQVGTSPVGLIFAKLSKICIGLTPFGTSVRPLYARATLTRVARRSS